MIFLLFGCSHQITVVFSFRDTSSICLMGEQIGHCATKNDKKNDMNHSIDDVKNTTEDILWTFEDITIGRQKWLFEMNGCEGDILVDVTRSWKNKIQNFSGQCSESVHGYELKSIPSGIYSIGNKENEDIGDTYDKEEMKSTTDVNNDTSKDDEIFHQVVIEQAFVIGTTEVTQEFFERVVGKNPASLDVNNCSRVGNKSSPNPKEPVYCVNWYEALEFANKLSEQNGHEPCYTILTKNAVWKSDCEGYRLPTESEWEIAAAQTSISQAWTIKNSEGRTHEVAQFSPNPYGLYDMLGNVWEWTWDGYGPYPKELTKNPKGTDLSGYRVMRGGTWAKGEDKARISDRANFHPAFRLDVTGFRLVRTLRDRDLNESSR